ncbi:MAG: YceI family protein [Gemmatimonadaceae bacterium]
MTATATNDIVATRPWQIDPAHTSAQFAVRHLMIATVKGSFSDITGTVIYDPAAGGAVDVDISVPVATVATRVAQRDAHLRSADFFDADNHPMIMFKGKRIEGDVRSEFRLIGDLTIRGTTREIVLEVTNEGSGSDPWGNERMGFSATAKVNRLDFGLKWNMVLEAGGMTVGDDVKISIDVEILRPIAA